MALTKTSTDGIKDDAISLDKLAHGTSSQDGKFLRANNGAAPSFETVSSVGGATGVDFNDNVKIRSGTGNDLEIYHDGSHSFIKDAGTGTLRIESSEVGILSADGSETMAQFVQDGAVSLRYDNTKHFETQTNGVKVDSSGDTVLELHTSNAGAHNRINFSVNSGDNYGGLWYSAGYNSMEFRTNNAERMRIDSSGRLLLNTPNSLDNEYRLHTYITSTGGHVFRPDGTSTRKPLAFQNNNGSEVGSVTSSTSSTSYNTSSDYRLKENITAISDGITRLKTLKPSKFNFKVDKDTTVDGFLAHEVTAVPEAITGTKDEVDSNNNPVYQSIDQSKLVPLLTAALQEAVAKIEVLETKVAALEAA